VRREGQLPRPRSKGSAALELALVLPLLLLILAGTMEFGRVFHVGSAVWGAARAGTQYGVQSVAKSQDLAGMEQAARNDAPGTAGLQVTTSRFCTCINGTSVACGTSGCTPKRIYVKVVTSAVFQTLASYPGVPNSSTVRAQSTLRVQ
jgi:Flp pilus assembly protein TadG